MELGRDSRMTIAHKPHQIKSRSGGVPLSGAQYLQRKCCKTRVLQGGASIYIYRRFRGACPACPTPVTGRSASFRLRFRFVRAVRAVHAGEAKLRGHM